MKAVRFYETLNLRIGPRGARKHKDVVVVITALKTSNFTRYNTILCPRVWLNGVTLITWKFLYSFPIYSMRATFTARLIASVLVSEA